MALPKKGTRKIEVQGKVYRWMVGKLQKSTHHYVNVAIESPDGSVKTFEEVVEICDDIDEDGGFNIPITPNHVRRLIEDNNL